jgi:hypothetical protein
MLWTGAPKKNPSSGNSPPVIKWPATGRKNYRETMPKGFVNKKEVIS